jgi:hypothetical protein
MSFIYPFFLFGLSAIAIPIIIHLFNLQRTKKIYFSNTAFLKSVQNISKRSIKVKNLYILLARIFFIVFLVFAFAQPIIPSKNKLSGAGFINIYIDNSLSTQSAVGNEKVLDVSVKGAESFASVLPLNALINLYTNDLADKQNPFINRSKVSEVVSNIQFSSKSTSFSQAIHRRQRRIAETEGRNKISYVFSDFQKSFLGDVNQIKLDSSKQYFLIPVTPENTSNVYIDSVWLESPYINLFDNNILKARVKNSGNDARENILLKLTIDGRQTATTSVNIAANSNVEALFNFNLSSGGLKNGIISITDYPVVFDNDFYFSLKTADKIRVLEVKSSKGSSPYIEKAFFNKELFDFSQRNIENLDYNSILNYDLVILNNLEEVSTGLSESLSKLIGNSAALLLVPSETADVESYNNFLAQYSFIVNKNKGSSDSTILQELQQPDLSNPFFKGIFENQKERMFLPKEKQLIGWNNIGINHLTFKDGSPFLTQVNTGRGKIFTIASNLQSNTGLPLNALFIPIIYKIAFAGKTHSDKLAYSLDDRFISLPIKTSVKNAVFKIVKDKMEIIPDQRLSNTGLMMEIPETEIQPGHYQLKLNDSIVSNIAFNYATRESIMEFYNAEELREIFAKNKNVEILDGAVKNDLADDVKEANTGLPLWKICLLISLLFLFIEILLLRYYKVQDAVKA